MSRLPHLRYSVLERLVDDVLALVGRRVRLALPLGLGKPNPLANALYARAAATPSLELEIATALTLETPTWSGELERRLLEPIVGRLYAGYPELDYAVARRGRGLPPNVRVREFFFAPGALLGSPSAQQDYISANYTHVARGGLEAGINVFAQLIAPAREIDGEPRHSLGSNPDISIELVPALRARATAAAPFVMLGHVNREMPFMFGDACVPLDFFDAVLDDPAHSFPLFGAPRQPVSTADYAIGLYAAALVRDGGTLQLGIGSLGDAITYQLLERHRAPARFRSLLAAAGNAAITGSVGGDGPFERGLYGASEMFVPGFLELYRAGILTRRVYDDLDTQRRADDGTLPADHAGGHVLHAAFFLGPREFYAALRALPEPERRLFGMMRVSQVNELYGDVPLRTLQRRHARFLNTTMQVSLLGAASSDALDDGRVVSGVGGQYNLVAMAHALPDARSVLMLRSSRTSDEGVRSCITWLLGNVTIPRHLRDVVVSEYGVADLRGRCDRDVVEAMLSIADARFQPGLADQARAAGKLPADYRMPDRFRDNTPARLEALLGPARADGHCPAFPFGSELTDEELVLARALRGLRSVAQDVRRLLDDPRDLATAAVAPASAAPYLERMGLDRPRGLEARLLQKAVLYALAREGAI